MFDFFSSLFCVYLYDRQRHRNLTHNRRSSHIPGKLMVRKCDLLYKLYYYVKKQKVFYRMNINTKIFEQN